MEIDETQWLKPAQVLEIYSGRNGGISNLREAIAFHLREGNLKACAKHVHESSKKKLSGAWAEQEREYVASGAKDREEFVAIDPFHWRASVSFKDDTTDWRWKGTDFS